MAMRRILVANRGEIARRVFRTARSLGLQTVAVYSEPDADAPFVREADLAVALRGATSAETYLDVEQIIDAVHRSGADAVHPGYGFLSENPEFAEGVMRAGATWIGPTPESIRAMALKVEAKRLAAEAGLPLVPGAEVPDGADVAAISQTAANVGYPVMIKASAGGGGKGMRIVSEPGQLSDALESARREAQSAFGDPTLFLERYLPESRHVEVQIFGDGGGNVVHLGERECSIQRRHQKIVEESPAPGVSREMAASMQSSAVALAERIGYAGAGTVEFIVWSDEGGPHYAFLEMNTRLQVEHPVTELVTGLDLVEWQIRVARGEHLPLAQGDIAHRGHAIEVRLYAEDPAHGYLPSVGTVTAVDFPAYLRVDSGVEAGSEVGTYYDPMLAKVIAHADDRATCADRLSRGLRAGRVHGLVTNRDSLVAILESPRFAAGDTTTAFLEQEPDVCSPSTPDDVLGRHLAAVAWAAAPPVDDVPRGWRNVPAIPELTTLDRLGGDAVQLASAFTREGLSLRILAEDTDPYVPDDDATRLFNIADDAVISEGVRTPSAVSTYGDLVCVDDGLWSTQWRRRSRFAERDAQAAAGGATTPMPGTVIDVQVATGDVVTVGQTLVVLEAMKMEHRIVADVDGVVAEVHVEAGQAVDAHAVVVSLSPTDDLMSQDPSDPTNIDPRQHQE